MKYYTIKIFFKFSFFFYTFFQTYSYPWWLDLYFDNNISFFSRIYCYLVFCSHFFLNIFLIQFM